MNAAQALQKFTEGKQKPINATYHVDWCMEPGETGVESRHADGSAVLAVFRADGTAALEAYDTDNEQLGAWELK